MNYPGKKGTVILICLIAVVIILFLGLGSAQSKPSNYPVTFKVSEKSTGSDLKFVQIEIWKGSTEYAAGQTQDDGSNYFDLPPGYYTYNVAYRESGWTSVWNQPLRIDGPTTISVQLERI